MKLKKTHVDVDRVWKALAKYGITTEEELDEAIKKMEPINIGCMVSPVRTKLDTGKASGAVKDK